MRISGCLSVIAKSQHGSYKNIFVLFPIGFVLVKIIQNVELTDFLISEIGGIFLGWFGIVYNALCLFAVPMMSYGVKKYKEAIENSQYSRMSNYGGYGSYRGYRDLDRVVRSISDNQVAKSVANISGGIMTFLIVLFCLSILMKLAASILLLIGTKNVSVNSYLYFIQYL